MTAEQGAPEAVQPATRSAAPSSRHRRSGGPARLFENDSQPWGTDGGQCPSTWQQTRTVHPSSTRSPHTCLYELCRALYCTIALYHSVSTKSKSTVAGGLEHAKPISHASYVAAAIWPWHVSKGTGRFVSYQRTHCHDAHAYPLHLCRVFCARSAPYRVGSIQTGSMHDHARSPHPLRKPTPLANPVARRTAARRGAP